MAITLIALPFVALSYVTFFQRDKESGRIGGRFAWLDTVGDWVTRLGRWNLYFVGALAVLALGELSGHFAGRLLADQVRKRIASGCAQHCFQYETADRRVVGVLVAEDTGRAAIYTSRGLVVLSNAEIHAVMPYRPADRSRTSRAPTTPPQPVQPAASR